MKYIDRPRPGRQRRSGGNGTARTAVVAALALALLAGGSAPVVRGGLVGQALVALVWGVGGLVAAWGIRPR